MATYTLITNTTLSSTSNSITFNSFSGYTDLVLVFQMRGEAAANVYLRFNGDSGNNYTGSMFTSPGSGTPAGSVATSANAINTITWTGASADLQSAGGVVHINNYANTNIWKTALSRYGTAYGEATMGCGLWKNTAAITSIQVLSAGPLYSVGSTFTLYGILGA